MDIGAFSLCIKDLIAEYDKVEVPDLGVFYAELMSASYSDKLTTINPPYRKMYFRKGEVTPEEGALLYSRIAETLNVSLQQAQSELKWCLGRMRSFLDGNKVCTLPGLGKMKATSQYDYFFVPDDDLDIYPDGIGLEPICIKVSARTSAKDTVEDLSRENATPLSNEAEECPREAITSQPSGESVSSEDQPSDNPAMTTESAGGTADNVKVTETAAEDQPTESAYPKEVLTEKPTPENVAGEQPTESAYPKEVLTEEPSPEAEAGEQPSESECPKEATIEEQAPKAEAGGQTSESEESQEEVSPSADNTGDATARKKHRIIKTIAIVLTVIFVLVIIAELLYLFREPLSPWLDRILYTPEELEIIRGSQL